MLSRRRFIRSAAASIALAPLCPLVAVPRPDVRVAIIGAGAAGISAARTLLARGVHVELLEARNRIGGRAVTDTASLGVAWDRGGSWLHSSDVNPLAPIAKGLGIELMADPRRFAIYRDQKPLGPEIVRSVAELRERAYAELAAAGERGLDVPASATLSLETRSHPLFAMVAAGIGGFEGVELEHFSALDSFNYVEAGPDLLIPSGYGTLIARLGRDLPVRLNEPVRRVDWSRERVQIDAHSGRTECDAVIITVPTSALTRNEIAFVPALPIETEQAFHDLPLGLLDKVALELEPARLPTEPDEFVTLATATDESFRFRTRIWGSDAVLGYLSGAPAHALEAEGEIAMIAVATEQLVAIFGSEIRAAVRRSAATRWGKEPFSLGSYSHCVPGRFGARAALTEPVGDRVYFAGEHTEQSAYGTIHGAWMSGERIARTLLERWSRPGTTPPGMSEPRTAAGQVRL
jgi:monoamine oxidase